MLWNEYIRQKTREYNDLAMPLSQVNKLIKQRGLIVLSVNKATLFRSF